MLTATCAFAFRTGQNKHPAAIVVKTTALSVFMSFPRFLARNRAPGIAVGTSDSKVRLAIQMYADQTLIPGMSARFEGGNSFYFIDNFTIDNTLNRIIFNLQILLFGRSDI